MRISNIETFLQGADDIVATQIVQGSAKHWQITLTDSNDMPIDLTGHTFEFDTITATGNVTPGSRGSFTIADLSLDDSATPVSRDNLVSNSAPTTGIIDLYLPADLFTGTVPFDSNTGVPFVIGTLRWTDGNASEPTIRSVRTLIAIRYGVRAA